MLTTLLLLITIVPGAYAWWSGRGLIRQIYDPLLPERFIVYWRRVLTGTLLTIVLIMISPILISIADLPPTRLKPLALIAFMLITVLAGTFPSRKTLFNETWSFIAYLECKIRFLLAFSGLRILLIFTPLLVTSAGDYRWQAVALLALVLYGRLFLSLNGFTRLLGAKPLPDEDIKARFDIIAARSTAAQPLYMSVDFPGGRIANAFAVAALPRPAVLFTQTLIDELKPEETDAIFAHELGHLEHMDGKFVKKTVVLTCLLIALALFTEPVGAWLSSGPLNATQLLIIGLILGFIHVRIIGHDRHHETDSDSRAVALCGDADALKRGLERLHELNRLPRRWDSATEQASTHPSLANRIRSIRDDADTNDDEAGAAMIFSSTAPGKYVILESNRIQWLEGVPDGTEPEHAVLLQKAATLTAIAYSELRELLIRPSGKQGAVLAGTDRKNRKWLMPLRQDDIPALQKALEQADRQVNQAQGINDRLLPIYLFTLVIQAIAIVMASALQLCLLCVFCFFRPRYYNLGALGAFAFGESMVSLLPMVSGPALSGPALAQSVALLLSGLSALGYALYQTRSGDVDKHRDYRFLLAVLALPALLGWTQIIWAFINTGEAFNLYHMARIWPEAATASFGLAGALFVTRNKPSALWSPILLGLAAATALFLQSSYFGLRFAHDPFAARPAPLHYETRSLSPVKETKIDRNTYNLRLSPQATWFAYLHQVRDKTDYRVISHSLVVADFAGQQSELPVDDAVFIDETQLLTLSNLKPAPKLRLYQWRQGSWQVKNSWNLPAINENTLSWDHATGYWRVLGNKKAGVSATDLTSVSGQLDSQRTVIQEFSVDRRFITESGFIMAGANLLTDRLIPYKNSFWPYSDFNWAYHEFWLSDSKYWRKIAATAVRRVNCLPNSGAAQISLTILCLAQEPDNARIGFLHTDTGLIDSIVEIRNTINPYVKAKGNGELFFLQTVDNDLMALDLSKHRALNLHLTPEDYIMETTIAGNFIAVISSDSLQDNRLIRLYRVDN